MATENVMLTDLHFEHRLWETELNFYADEIAIYENRLSDLVTGNRGKDILPQLEQFQNQFIRQKEVIDHMRHDIREHEHAISHFAEANPRYSTSDEVRFEDHDDLRERMDQFKKIYAELKKDFYQFMRKWL
jgi:hypothetical protein